MKKYIRPFRLFVLALMLVSVLGIYVTNLYKIQIVNAVSPPSGDTRTVTYTVRGARGDILDRNGTLLVSSSAVYDLKFDYTMLQSSDTMCDDILRLIQTAEENGVEHNDTFPVTEMPTFAYTVMSESQEYRLSEYLNRHDLDEDISATDLVVWMKSHYGIDYTTSLYDTRRILGVLYELDIRTIINTTDYVFANDVDIDFISLLLESDFPGIVIDTSFERTYHTSYAAHILGRIGQMNDEEYEIYKEYDYPMDALIGKDGVEAAFEEYLHGVDGQQRVTYDTSTGAIVDIVETEAASQGQNVYLTNDSGLQAAAENALSEIIESIGADREYGDKPTGGAIVVRDVQSGEVLASASAPTFDISTLSENYSALANDESAPLFNRATQGTYNPGSTWKMVVSLAGFQTGKLNLGTYITDEGIFTKYAPSYSPRCWIYPAGTHGRINVIGALAQSCNYFFYWLGDTLGIDAMADAAAQFGFGQKTGIEITESAGVLATPEYKEENVGEMWYAADNLLTAIGQGYSYCTPIQLANYVSCIANGGTLYKTTLLDRVMSSDYRSVTYTNSSEILNTIDNSGGFIDILHSGMEAVVEEGTAHSYFVDYPVSVAAKTGTVQSSTTTYNNAVFVCYAPADEPEIAISVVIEKGGSGSAVVPAAKYVLDYYFADYYTSQTGLENELVK